MNSFEIKIGAASVDDLIRHLRECSGNFEPPLESYVDITEYAGKIFGSAVTFEAWNNKNELIGLTAVYYNDPAGKSGYVTNVSVSPAYQGGGVAAAMLGHAIGYGAEKGFATLELEVFPGNARALSLYRRAGFIETGRDRKIRMTRRL